MNVTFWQSDADHWHERFGVHVHGESHDYIVGFGWWWPRRLCHYEDCGH